MILTVLDKKSLKGGKPCIYPLLNMVKNNLSLFLWIILFNAFQASGQENRYIVYFTDKNNSEFAIDRPLEFLSERAIQRRQKNQVAITESDLPVNETYLQQITALGAEVFYTSKWFNAALVTIDDSQVADIELLDIVEGVEFVAPGGLARSKPTTNRKYERNLTGKRRRQQTTDVTDLQNRMLAVTYMHDLGYRGEGILIGVFDSGFSDVDNLFYFEHLFTDNRIKHTFNYVENNTNVYSLDDHGTEVLSCMAAFSEGQIIGTAPGAEYILYITEDIDSEYRIEEFNWIFAAEMADSAGVDIINTALGYNTFDDPSMDYEVANMDGQTTFISLGAQIAAEKGILLITSAGNLGNDPSWEIVTAPGDVDEGISVGAIRSDSSRSSFSSTGPTADGRVKPDVVALGSATVVGFNESSNNPITSSGTSFSTPLVAGLAAGIMQAFSDKTKDEVLQIIKDSGHQSGDPDNELGYGIPSFSRVRNLIVGIEDELEGAFNFFPNPVSDEFFLELDPGSLGESIKIIIHNSMGQIVYENDFPAFSGDEQIKINTINFRPGLYILKVLNNKNHLHFKFLKK